MSFHSPEGHNLRKACLKAMGKIKSASNEDRGELESFLNRIDEYNLENAPDDVKGAVKEEAVLLVTQASIRDLKIPMQYTHPIKEEFERLNIGIKEIIHSKDVQPSKAGRFFDYVKRYLNYIAFKDGFVFLSNVIKAETPEELASVYNMTMVEFFKALGVSSSAYESYIKNEFGSKYEFLDYLKEYTILKWLYVMKFKAAEFLDNYKMGSIIKKIGMWSPAGLILGVIFGQNVVANFLRKYFGAFSHLPIVYITSVLQGIRTTIGYVAKIASSVFNFVKSWFTKAMYNEGVMKQARLLANRDSQFKYELQGIL